jgi:hypothetical protein
MAVMSEVLITGNNPYEVFIHNLLSIHQSECLLKCKIPGKTDGVGGMMRKRMYSWVLQYQEFLFSSTSIAPVAVYHSSASRDYSSSTPTGGRGCGAFCVTDPYLETPVTCSDFL